MCGRDAPAPKTCLRLGHFDLILDALDAIDRRNQALSYLLQVVTRYAATEFGHAVFKFAVNVPQKMMRRPQPFAGQAGHELRTVYKLAGITAEQGRVHFIPF